MSGITILSVKEVTEESLKKAFKEPKEIKCPNCNYGGEDLKIGREPISQKMMCSKCKRYFYPFANNSQQLDVKGTAHRNGEGEGTSSKLESVARGRTIQYPSVDISGGGE